MSVLSRTLIAVPVALTAIGLFAATSRMEWDVADSMTLETTIETDAEGHAWGEAIVTVDASVPGGATVYLQVVNEDARRSLKAWDASDPEMEEYASRVRDGVGFWLGVPGDCEEYDPMLDEPGLGDAEQCTLRIEVAFDGRSDDSEPIQVRAELGDYDYTDERMEDGLLDLEWVASGPEE